MTDFDLAVRLLSALPFDQRCMVLFAATCWSDEKFNATIEERGAVAVKLLRQLSPSDRAAALYEASPPESRQARQMLIATTSRCGGRRY
jgi:hypothetical protein